RDTDRFHGTAPFETKTAPRIPRRGGARLAAMPELYHTRVGPPDAPVVLLLHGLGACADDWSLQIGALSANYRVLTVDLPGHRYSSLAPGAASIRAMASEVTQLLDLLAIEAAHVVGLSLGGCVALALAIHASTRVNSLVLVNTFAR